MIKRIIFEGMDRLGKSTQINLLEKFLKKMRKKSKIYHFIGPEDKRTETQLKNFTNTLYLIDVSDEIALCDRDIYGEYIYGKMYRNNNPNFIFTLENVFKNLTDHSIFFLMEDSIKNVLKRDDGKSDTLNYWKKLYEKIRFRICFYKSKIKYKKIINIKGKSIEDVNMTITDYIIKIMMLKGFKNDK
jgi:thymidylate kinase